MKLTRLNDWHVVLTAHDSARCDHRIAVVAFPSDKETAVHVTCTWGDSGGPLGRASTREFRDTLNCALLIADYMSDVGAVHPEDLARLRLTADPQRR